MFGKSLLRHSKRGNGIDQQGKCKTKQKNSTTWRRSLIDNFITSPSLPSWDDKPIFFSSFRAPAPRTYVAVKTRHLSQTPEAVPPS